MAPSETDKKTGKAFPLSYAATGEKLRIQSLGMSKSQGRRLADLGLPVGSEIEVMHRQGPGRLVVAKGPTRMALGTGMSQTIMVTLS